MMWFIISSWIVFFFSSRRRHTRCSRDWSSGVCSSDLRAGADYVIVVAHEGAFCDRAGGACHGEIVDLARGLDSGSVDLIVSGHTHSLVNTVVNGIPVAQARSSGAGIAVVDFLRGRQVRARIETPFADLVHPDDGVADSVRAYAGAVAALTSRPVARVEQELRRVGDEYGLGRLIADAQRRIARSDVALVNNGGIRADVPAGAGTDRGLFPGAPVQKPPGGAPPRRPALWGGPGGRPPP